MTAGDYLDGLPSVETFEQERRGRWVAFPEGHSQYGSAFYLADPYWWDGVYPNAIRMTWGIQFNNPMVWEVTFWASDEAASGAFFRIETRSDWTVSVPSTVPPTANPSLVADGHTRMQAGVIQNNVETVEVERYFDTVNGSAGNASGSALFAVFKTTSGYVASISGPRVWCAFSFACDSVFNALPRLLTKNWASSGGASRPLDDNLLPTSVRRDLGPFTLVPESGLTYDLSDSAFFEKPHGSERSEVRVRHVAIGATDSSRLSQKLETEVVSVGAYGTAGNRFIPYARAGSDPRTITITAARTGDLTYAPNVAGSLYGAVVASIPQRTLTTTLSGLQGLGTHFTIFPQSAPTGSAAVPDQPVPLFSNAFGSGGAYTEPRFFWNEYPDFSDVVDSQQERFNNFAASRTPPITGSQYYYELVAAAQQRVADQDGLYAEWNDPNSTKSTGEFFAGITYDGSYPVFQIGSLINFRSAFQLTGQTVTCGDQVSGRLGLGLAFQTAQINSAAENTSSNSTAERLRSGVASTHNRTGPTADGQAAFANFGPHTRSFYRKVFFEPIEFVTVPQSVLIVPLPLRSGALQTKSGQTLFEHKYLRAIPGVDHVGIEKPALSASLFGFGTSSLADAVAWGLPPMSPENVAVLLSNHTVTYEGTANASGAGLQLATFPASVTVTLT